MLSLTPGGGRGGSRLFAPRSTLSYSSDLTDVGDAPSFAVKAVEVSEAILKLNQEISSDLFGEEQSWGRSESQAPNTFGEILGSLVMANASDFEMVKEILVKMEDEWFTKAVLDAVIKSVSESLCWLRKQ